MLLLQVGSYQVVLIVVMFFLQLGFKITEVAHDYVPALKNWFERVREILNSYDSWHGNAMLIV